MLPDRVSNPGPLVPYRLRYAARLVPYKGNQITVKICFSESKFDVTHSVIFFKGGSCSEDQILCDDRITCYDPALRCDGTPQCPDGSDETSCGQ